MNKNSNKPYRPCIVAVFINHKKEVLVAKRSGLNTWQFPQGGIEEGENSAQALAREMKEEIGSDQFCILKKAQNPIYYDFPPDLAAPIAHHFRGQIQDWFLCEFNAGAGPELKLATDKEFDDCKWVSCAEALAGAIYWKKNAYSEGLKALGLT